MSDKPTYEAVVAAAKRLDQTNTSGCILLGKRIHSAIRKHLSGVKAAGARRERRSEAITGMAAAIDAAGVKVPANLNAIVGVSQVASIFGEESARLSIRVLRTFASTIRRNAKSETWDVRPKVKEQAHTLFARVVAESMTSGQVQAEINALLKRKPRRTRPKQSAVRRVLTAVSALDTSQQEELYRALQRKFSPVEKDGRSVPERENISIPITPPAKPVEAKPGFLGRLANKAG